MCAISCGLDGQMLENMTVSNVVDYIITYNKLHNLDKENDQSTREATQKDFDNF